MTATAHNADAIRGKVRELLAKYAPNEVDEHGIRALLVRFEGAYRAGRADAAADCLAPDMQWTLPCARVLRGREEARRFLAERFADPDRPRFEDSRFDVRGDMVIQTYRVSVTLPCGTKRELAGTDVYRIRGGLIASKDAYWKQLGTPSSSDSPASKEAVVSLPLRIGSAGDAHGVNEIIARVAAMPALANLAAKGLLRFDLRLDGAVAAAKAIEAPRSANPAPAQEPCCNSCSDDKPRDDATVAGAQAAPDVPMLKGTVTERTVKALDAKVRMVGVAPGAVLTPLAREAIRRRGIEIQHGGHS